MAFHQEIWLRFWDALFTGIFVAVAGGLITWRVQHRAQTARSDHETQRDEAYKARERQLDVEREGRALRRTLVRRSSELHGGFHLLTQQVRRQKRDPDNWGTLDVDAFDRSYVEWAGAADALERDIAAVYGWSTEVEALVHQLRDLLTVGYFNLRARRPEQIREKNAVRDASSEGRNSPDKEVRHTGLTAEELADTDAIVNQVKRASMTLAQQLLRADFKGLAGTAFDVRLPSVE